MNFAHHLGAASGSSREDCHFLGYRYDERWGFKPDTGESWVLATRDGQIHPLLYQHAWLTDLWRSPSGQVFITNAVSRVYYNPDATPRAEDFRYLDVAGTLSGVWGLDDEHVFVWGVRGGKGLLYRGSGEGFEPMEAPGRIVSLHGIRPDLIFAVGFAGLIARWDGTRWHNMASPVPGTLSSVFVVNEDEVYACGPARALLKGSVDGWSELLRHGATLDCVARWNDALWVGSGDEGLYKCEDDQLVMHKPKVKAQRLDVRGDLVASCMNAVVGSRDGVDFVGTMVSTLEDASKDTPPAWNTR